MKRYGIFPIILCALACLAACGGRSPQPEYYLLGEERPAAVSEQGDRPAVALRQVALPSYLDRDALVLRSGGAVRISVAEYHLWAEPLNKAVPRLLEESMRPRLQEKGLNLVWPDAADAALQVDAVLLRLDGSPGGNAELSARWRIADRAGTLLAQGLFARDMDAGGGYADMVRALSRLLADFGRELAQAVGEAYGRLAEHAPDEGGKGKKGRKR